MATRVRLGVAKWTRSIRLQVVVPLTQTKLTTHSVYVGKAASILLLLSQSEGVGPHSWCCNNSTAHNRMQDLTSLSVNDDIVLWRALSRHITGA